MRNKKKILVTQLDQKLQPFQKAGEVTVPEKGWINAIRTTLNMTLEQLGDKLQITRQGVKKIEESEAKGSITLRSLREAGEALDLKLVYGFVPKDGTFEQLIEAKAENIARNIVLRTHQNMVLENQAVYQKTIKENIAELTEELKRKMKKSLWD